ncbi:MULTISPECIES: LysR family transcriptional regulator [Burkholderia]|uniref:LysR family transcriptional regulator n=1 Tax=Burkholderia paludis TaxID=1506587 RepID=A0A6P2L6T4_9BURK|nr:MULTISPECIES: LysR family transcriptional regulator [Burkholderia]CAB3756546.1 HTH-type transcriptional regulator DmlR [Burkholderia paludis]VWB62599.1 LysR family transcriptional regulator [Burkholderia paludis]
MPIPPTDRFRGILAFVQAVECGSFSVASRRMGQSPSSVGKAVARLEERLGVRLFKRTTRRMTLTDEGEAYHETCLRTLAELDRAESTLAERRQTPTGRVRIALPVLYGRIRVLPVLNALAERHPALDLDVLFSGNTADLVEQNIDLAVRIGRLEDSASHVARPLGEQALRLCAAPGYLDRHGTPSSREALDHHRRIALLRGDAEVAWQFSGDAGRSARQSRHARLRLSDVAAVKDAALAGLGLAQLPGWFVEDDIRAGRLLAVLPDAQPAPLPIHVLWSKTTRMTARLRVTIDALVEHLSHRHDAPDAGPEGARAGGRG